MAGKIFNFKPEQVYINDWLFFHPYQNAGTADSYYLKLCKEVYVVLTSPKHVQLSDFLDKDDIKVLSCFLVAYFEDIISGIGLWETFTSEHFKLYNKYLPFYEPVEYLSNEINVEDIYFLIWYFLSIEYYHETTFSPVFDEILHLGNDIYPIFDREYEFAPENKKLQDFFMVEPDANDFHKVKEKMKWLGLNSYLFYFQRHEFDDEIAKMLEKNKGKEDFEKNMDIYIYDTIDSHISNKVSPLLALKTKDWMAGVLGKNHLLYNDTKNFSDKKTGIFLYQREDTDSLYFKHLATDTIIPATKKSIDKNEKYIENETIVLIGFVKWKGEWWFSGTSALLDYNPNLVEKEKESKTSRMLFNDEKTEKQMEVLELQKKAFLKLTGGHLIVFLKNGSLFNEFMQEFNKSYIDFLDIPKKEKEKEKKELISKMLIRDESEGKILSENGSSPVLLFFNDESGIEIATGVNELIPDSRNPDYNEDSDPNEFLDLIEADSISKEFVQYIIKEYKLTDVKFPGNSGSILMDNLDFMMRFNKRKSYYTKPELSFV